MFIKNTKTFVMLSILITLTSQECTSGCLKCDLSPKSPESDQTQKPDCQFCDITQNYIYEDKFCTKAKYPNCKKYSVTGYCTECSSGSYLSNGECLGIAIERQIENCEYYSSSSSCGRCKKEHYLVDAKCQKVESSMEGCDEYKHGDWGSCEACQEGYMMTRDLKSCIKVPDFADCYNFNSIRCRSCKNEFNLNPNMYLNKILDVFNESGKELLGEWLSLNKSFYVPTCETIIAKNCKKLIRYDQCEICEEKFFLGTDGLCHSYPEDSIVNCEKYELGVNCIQCSQGYYIKTPTTCELVEPITNCIQYDQTVTKSKCTRCGAKFILFEEVCRDRSNLIEFCDLHYNDNEMCEKCIDGYKTTNEQLRCLPLIDKCYEYEFSNQFTSSLTCKFCNEAMTFMSSSDKCEDGNVENCVYFKNNNECYECKNQFYIPSDECIKHFVIENCITYERIKANECKTCENSTYLVSRINKCEKTVEISQCEEFSKINKCSKCANYFYLVDTPDHAEKLNTCAEIDVALSCLQMENGKCILCRKNYVLEDGLCSLAHDSLQENCASHNADGLNSLSVFKCDYCKKNCYPRNLKDQFVCTSLSNLQTGFQVQNCIKYKWDTGTLTFKCAFCRDGFFLDDKNCVTECSIAGHYIFLQKITKIRESTGNNNYNFYNLESSNICGALSNGPSNCRKVALNTLYQTASYLTTDYVCVECFNNYFPIIKLKTTTNFDPSDLEKDAQGPLSRFPGIECKELTSEIIESNNKKNNLVENCSYYYRINKNYSDTAVYACFRCKFGYTGVVVQGNTDNTNSYIDSCHQINDVNDAETTDATDGKCDTSVIYQGYTSTKNEIDWNKVPLESFITCHKCQDLNGQEFRPFIFTKRESSDTGGGYNQSSNSMTRHLTLKKYSIKTGSSYYDSGSGGRMHRCLVPTATTFNMSSSYFNIFDSNNERPLDCAMYMVDTGTYTFGAYYAYEKNSSSLNGHRIYCVACMPGLKPSRPDYGSDYFYPYFIYNCLSISNCKSGGTWVNNCEECDDDYYWNWNDTDKSIEYDQCVYYSPTSSNYVKNCMVVTSGGVCKFCKKGYEFYTIGITDPVTEVVTNLTICEKSIPGFCNDTETIFSRDQEIVMTHIYLGKNLLYFKRHASGCNNCREGYISIQQIEDQYICSSSGILETSTDIENFTVANCKSFTVDLITKKLFCEVCELGYVATSDGQCENENDRGLENCLLAIKESDEVFGCEQCVETFIFLNSKCVKGTIDKCLEYTFNKNSTTEICGKCEDGYFTTSSSCVKGQIKNCKEYTSETVCKTCDIGYQLLILKDDVPYCVEIPLDLECRVFKEEDFQNRGLNCFECKSGFFPSRDGEFPKSYCLPFILKENCYLYDLKDTIIESTFECIQCNINYYLDIETNTCKERTKIDLNCINIDKKLDKCIECKTGFYIAENNLDCKVNPTGVPGCRNYQDLEICLDCRENFYLNKNECISIPEAERIANCQYYREADKCSQCLPTHYTVNNGCKETIAKDCQIAKNSTACQTCIPDYGYKIDEIQNIQVDCVPYTDKNCLKPQEFYPFDCNQCIDNYYPLKGLCTIRQLDKIENCIAYETENECQICIPGLVLSIDKRSCESSVFYDPYIDPNCEETFATTPPYCSSCDKGFYFKDGVCVACEGQTVESGCFYCDAIDNSKCLMCATGYYMNDQGNCVKQNAVVGNDTVVDEEVSWGKVLRIFFVLIVVC